jgi:hypothetical protein
MCALVFGLGPETQWHYRFSLFRAARFRRATSLRNSA